MSISSFTKRWCRWHYKTPQENCGVILACDQDIEWMIPWWWENYSAHNSYPVVMMDIGLSKNMHLWCKKKMRVQKLDIPNSFVKMQGELRGSVCNITHFFTDDKAWSVRIPWFKKPLAALHTPFQKTLLLDIDCEVRDSLDSLFLEADKFSEVGCVLDQKAHETRYRDYKACKKGETQYNAGVVLFHYGAKTIEKWARICSEENEKYYGDQEALSSLSLGLESSIFSLHSKYNNFY